MNSLQFVLLLGAGFAMVAPPAFKLLPRKDYQIVATIPVVRDGKWSGINVTAYGLISATSGVIGVAAYIIMMASLGIPYGGILASILPVLAICIPAAKLVAMAVEGKKHTFTIGGASFIGIIVMPFTILGVNALTAHPLPIMPAVAAMAVAYIISEGFGRLACLSFGCCYGKPVRECGHTAQRVFSNLGMTFEGKLKKASYASGLDGVPTVPVQAATYILFVTVGLVGLYLFLTANFIAAFLLAMIVSQGWRAVSETMRADYRGERRVSAYQWMSIFAVLYSIGIVYFLGSTTVLVPDLGTGISALWHPSVVLLLQLLWLGLAAYMGVSTVTGCALSFHVHEDRV